MTFVATFEVPKAFNLKNTKNLYHITSGMYDKKLKKYLGSIKWSFGQCIKCNLTLFSYIVIILYYNMFFSYFSKFIDQYIYINTYRFINEAPWNVNFSTLISRSKVISSTECGGWFKIWFHFLWNSHTRVMWRAELVSLCSHFSFEKIKTLLFINIKFYNKFMESMFALWDIG